MHAVAVAEVSGRLTEYVAWFKKSKHKPNLTEFANATMPKGRGRKRGKCPQKRRAPTVTSIVVENPNLSEAGSSSVPSQDSFATAAPIPQQVIPQQVTPHYHLTAPPSSGYPWPYYSQFPVLPSYNHQLPSPSISLTSHSPHPFTLYKIAGNISVCAGCKNRYPKNPLPPNDICIRHQEWREFIPTGSQVPQSRFGNAYYHFNLSCIFSHWPNFDPSTQLQFQDCAQDLEDTQNKTARRIRYLYINPN